MNKDRTKNYGPMMSNQKTNELAQIEPRMTSQRCETKQTKNENEQNNEWRFNDEESREQMIMFRQEHRMTS